MKLRAQHFATVCSLVTVSALATIASGCGSSSSGDDTNATPPAGAGGTSSAGAGGGTNTGGNNNAGTSNNGGSNNGGKAGSAAGGSSTGGATNGGSAGNAIADDPVWGAAAVICPTTAPDPTAPALLGGDCDPTDPTFCGFPYPSNVYLADDPTGKNLTGKSVRFGKTSLPAFLQGKVPMDPAIFYDRDGFSPGSTILFHMPGATATGMADPDHIADSLLATSPTVVMEAETGVLIPHWAEMDVSALKNTQVAILIHPAVRLKDQTRYIVAIRNVVDGTGAPIKPPPFFQALRDGTTDCAPQLATLRAPAYADIFGRLASANIDKSNLQAAWDYTTSSRDSNTSTLIKLRDDALSKYGTTDHPFQYTVQPTDVTTDPDTATWKRVVLSVTLPLYLNTAAPFDPTDPSPVVPQLNRDASGNVVQNGEFQWQIRITIPNSAKTAAAKSHGLLQNEHGLLGSSTEGQNGSGTDPGYLEIMSNEHNWIGFGIDFMGFCHEDVPLLSDALVANPSEFIGFVDRQTQGHLNQLLAMRFMMTTFAKGIVDSTGATVFDGMAVDPGQRAYRGDSQGGIMGITYMAISTDVTRGLLGEPGMSYSVVLNRSEDYDSYRGLLYTSLNNYLSIQMALGAFQMNWDRTEPDGYAPYINQNTLPCTDAVACPGGVTPTHQILIHDGLGDCQVTSLGAHILARTVGAKDLSPAPRTVYGVDMADMIPNGGSGMVEYDFHLMPAPITDMAPDTDYCNGLMGAPGHDPHDWIRQLSASYDQSDDFFRTGEIKPYCHGGKADCNCYHDDPPTPADSCDNIEN